MSIDIDNKIRTYALYTVGFLAALTIFYRSLWETFQPETYAPNAVITAKILKPQGDINNLLRHYEFYIPCETSPINIDSTYAVGDTLESLFLRRNFTWGGHIDELRGRVENEKN